MTKILVLDNYDSFVYTLNGYLQQLGAETEVLRNDVVTEAELPALLAKYDAVLLSPGPGTPADAGLSIPTVKLALQTGKSVFGVCLGHQAIAEAMGATVTSAEELMHGKTSEVQHDNSLVFKDVPQPFVATRYHSLAIEKSSLPAALEVTATSSDGEIMGVRHRELAVEGVQFHPEFTSTPRDGHPLFSAFISAALEHQAHAVKQAA